MIQNWLNSCDRMEIFRGHFLPKKVVEYSVYFNHKIKILVSREFWEKKGLHFLNFSNYKNNNFPGGRAFLYDTALALFTAFDKWINHENRHKLQLSLSVLS